MDENDRTSVININTENYKKELIIFGPPLFDYYQLIKNYKDFKIGTILKLKTTKSFNEELNTWIYVFEIDNNQILEMNSILEKEYLRIFQFEWKPIISRHITILGNNFDYIKHSPMIASEELSKMLMVPEWSIKSFSVISWIICFGLLIFSTKIIYTPTYANDHDCYYHLIILNYFDSMEYKKFGKYFYDLVMIGLLFLSYNYSSNYFEQGYWLDNISITNMINSKNFEYLILFLFMIYSLSMYVLINFMNKDHNSCPINLYQDQPSNLNFSKLGFYSLIYIFMCLLQALFLFFYILFQFIPKENNFFSIILPQKIDKLLFSIFPLIYSFISTFILPFLLNRFQLKSKYQTFLSILTTIIFTFILPLLYIFLLSNDCMNLWVKFWEPCLENQSQTGEDFTFDLKQATFPYDVILTNAQICDFKYNQFSSSKCTRSISRVISHLNVLKLMYSGIVLPVVAFFITFLKIECYLYHEIGLFKPNMNDHQFFNALFIYITYLILFGFGCPLIILIVYASVFFHMLLLLHSKKYLKIKFFRSEYSMSIHLLYVILFLNHCLSICFWISNDFVLSELFITFLILFWSFIFLQIFFPAIFDYIIQNIVHFSRSHISQSLYVQMIDK